jgi:hypothetical protein
VPRKAPGIDLVILNSYVSQSTYPKLIEFSENYNVIMPILRSDTAATWKLLDRRILGPFERVLKENYNYFVYMHRNRQVT